MCPSNSMVWKYLAGRGMGKTMLGMRTIEWIVANVKDELRNPYWSYKFLITMPYSYKWHNVH